jgi:hypothetical protein
MNGRSWTAGGAADGAAEDVRNLVPDFSPDELSFHVNKTAVNVWLSTKTYDRFQEKPEVCFSCDGTIGYMMLGQVLYSSVHVYPFIGIMGPLNKPTVP